MSDDQFDKIYADLQTAKSNVRWLLDHSNGLVDTKGLVHWAGRVVSLRDQVKDSL